AAVFCEDEGGGWRAPAGRRAVGRRVFRDPVLTGEASVEHTVGDVGRHLLCADQHAIDLWIVNRRKVRSRACIDVESGARKQLDRRVLQRAFGDAEFERISHNVCSSSYEITGERRKETTNYLIVPSSRTLKKHVRSPV